MTRDSSLVILMAMRRFLDIEATQLKSWQRKELLPKCPILSHKYGLDIYNSKQVREKHLARVVGKITTIAAAIYLRMAARPPVLSSNHLSYTENFLYMAVLKMLSEIETVENIPEFIEGVKARKQKLSGFGHRIYRNYDPRAKVLRKLADEVFSIVCRDPLIEVAVMLEKVALSDEFFVKRKLYPNVDFYSGLI